MSQHSHHRGRRGNGSPHRGSNPVHGVENWGEPLTIQVPSGIADVLRTLIGPETRRNHQRPRHCNKKRHQKHNRAKHTSHFKRDGNDIEVEKEIQELEQDTTVEEQEPEDSNNVTLLEKRLKTALENNENIPKWLTAMLPPLNIEDNEPVQNKTEEKKAGKEIKQNDDEDSDVDGRFGNDDDVPKWLKFKQAAQRKKAAIREARMKKFSEKKQKQRMSKGEKGCKDKKVRISTHKTFKKNIGPFEMELTLTEKEILTPKTQDEKKNEEEVEEETSTDQNITQLLAGLEEEEKVQLFNILKKLIGKKSN